MWKENIGYRKTSCEVTSSEVPKLQELEGPNFKLQELKVSKFQID